MNQRKYSFPLLLNLVRPLCKTFPVWVSAFQENASTVETVKRKKALHHGHRPMLVGKYSDKNPTEEKWVSLLETWLSYARTEDSSHGTLHGQRMAPSAHQLF